MKLSSLAVLVTLSMCARSVVAADATSPIDYAGRNTPFAPGAAVATPKQKPVANDAVQDKRVEKSMVEKQTAPVANRHAPVEVKETREKQVRDKQTRRPEVLEQPSSRFNHQAAALSTASDTTKPPMVGKYQDSLAAASATNMARFPAIDQATTAKINRFVFRKNPSEPSAVTKGSPVTPAAGGSAVQK